MRLNQSPSVVVAMALISVAFDLTGNQHFLLLDQKYLTKISQIMIFIIVLLKCSKNYAKFFLNNIF